MDMYVVIEREAIEARVLEKIYERRDGNESSQ